MASQPSLLPAVERLLRNAHLPTHVADRHAPGQLLQDRGDLLDRKALLLHGIPSWPSGRIVPQDSRCRWSEKLEPLTTSAPEVLPPPSRRRSPDAYRAPRRRRGW
jgi:hypothetical protein